MTASLETQILLRYADPRGRLQGVRLVADLWKRGPRPEFSRARRGEPWELRLPEPPVDRFEYELELLHRGGRRELVLDPEAAGIAPAPFGPKSVWEAAGYEPPAWLEDEAAPAGRVEPLELGSRALRATVTGALWSAAGTDRDERLPLLVVHDGPEYADYSALLRLLDSAVAEHELPPFRAALLAPVRGRRGEDYSASARYADTLVRELLPRLSRLAPSPSGRAARVGMGASLGALAMLHAHRTRAAAFGALFLQSGSFFRPRTDVHERGFPRFGRIARFVGETLRAPRWADPVPVALTCGTAEENVVNNRALATALREQGYEVDLTEIRDGHNWTAWRDSLHPPLVELLQRVWL